MNADRLAALQPITTRAHELFRHHPRAVAIVGSALSILTLSSPWLVSNYRSYLSLGKGGMPYNVAGCFVATFLLKPFSRNTVDTSAYLDGGEAWLDEKPIPKRGSERPKLGWHPVPHRQVNQIPNSSVVAQLETALKQIALQNPALVTVAPSLQEKQDNALFVHPSIPTHAVAQLTRREIVHSHITGDGSMHLALSPRDCKLVIQQGWGERHPLAGALPQIPTQILMIYAPRDDEELGVVERIIKAAVGYMTSSHEVV